MLLYCLNIIIVPAMSENTSLNLTFISIRSSESWNGWRPSAASWTARRTN